MLTVSQLIVNRQAGRYQCRGCTLQAKERVRSKMETPGLQGSKEDGLVFPGGFFVSFLRSNFNVDGNPLKNSQMMRSRMGIQVRV